MVFLQRNHVFEKLLGLNQFWHRFCFGAVFAPAAFGAVAPTGAAPSADAAEIKGQLGGHSVKVALVALVLGALVVSNVGSIVCGIVVTTLGRKIKIEVVFI